MAPLRLLPVTGGTGTDGKDAKEFSQKRRQTEAEGSAGGDASRWGSLRIVAGAQVAAGRGKHAELRLETWVGVRL